jgi:uncharacterized membrane protein
MSDITPKTHRLESIDYLRGLVMVIMALDHVRDYFSSSPIDPLAPEASTPLFLTRLVTNICAPTFVLLAGVSAGLMSERKTKAELSRFLFTRGLWLVALEATVVTFGWKFNFSDFPGTIILSVIWAIGVAMIVLGGLIHLPRFVVVCFGLAIVLGHNLLDGMLPSSVYPNETAPFWMNLHQQVLWQPLGVSVVMHYPTHAWIGVMVCGFGLARVFSWESKRRIKYLVSIGGGLIALFLILRGFNLYGDSNTWQPSESIALTVRDFLDVSKYPPSLHFLGFNIGVALVILGAVEKWRPPLSNAMVTIGQVPLFYYVGHIYLAHALAVLAGVIQGFAATDLLVMFMKFPEGYGLGLFGVYVVWLIVLLIMYLPCRWFARLKATRKVWWLSYL